ncbi:MAG: GTP-binding protein [Candidatus Thorarchaeota archaeon]
MQSPKLLFEIEDDINTSAIATGDVTGSGLPELCTGGRDGIIKLYAADSNTVRLLAQLDVPGSVLTIRIADVNGDGRNEIVVGRSLGVGESPGVSGTLQIYRFVNSGHLELLAEHPIDRFVTSVYVVDVTGDGRDEIVAGGSDSTLRVLSVSSDNMITELVNYQLDDMPLSIGICDADGDEVDELVVGNRDKTVRVFKIHDRAIEQIEMLKLPSPVISIASGDILGDRKMELGVVTHDGSIRVYRNEENHLELFSTLEGVKALSIRISELNADHMDEIVVATSDYKIVYYNLYMGELREIARVEVGSKILSIAIGDVGGDDLKEILVGVSGGPLKVIQGLYQVVPRFDVEPLTETGTTLTGRLTVINVSDRPINGITGKIYWFPKDHLEIDKQQIRLDLAPGERKTVEIVLTPLVEGTVIVRPIVLMWTDERGQVNQVTTPETAISVQMGKAYAAPVAEAPAITKTDFTPSTPVSTETVTQQPVAAVEGTGFSPLTAGEISKIEQEFSGVSEESLKAAEGLFDRLFGNDSAEVPDPGALADIRRLVTESPVVSEAGPAPAAEVPETAVESALVTEIRSRTPKPPMPGTSPESYSYLFKTMIVGEGAVGKTALVNRYVSGTFERDYKTTIGSQFAVKLTHIFPPDSPYAVGVKIQAWDVAGQSRFAAVRGMYYKGAAGVILVFDVTRRRSFTELSRWVQEADEHIGFRVPMVCVGNKVDLPDRAVSSEEAKAWAESNGFLYMESSAKTGRGVADMFTVLAELMYREAKKSASAKR